MTGSASRRKGNRAEQAVARWLTRNGHPATSTRANRAGMPAGHDIHCPSLGRWAIEVKDQRRLAVPAWWRQTVAQADGRLPVLIVKRPGVTDVGFWWAFRLSRPGWGGRPRVTRAVLDDLRFSRQARFVIGGDVVHAGTVLWWLRYRCYAEEGVPLRRCGHDPCAETHDWDRLGAQQ